MQEQPVIAVVLVGHALVAALLIVATVQGGVLLAVHLAVETPTPTPSLHPALARPVLPPPLVVEATTTPLPATPPSSIAPEPTAAPTATEVPSPTPLPLAAVDAGGRGARLRDEPGLRAAILGVLPERMPVAVLGPEAEEDGHAWRRIRSPDGLEGWVDAGLLAPVEGPMPAAPTAARQPVAVGLADGE